MTELAKTFDPAAIEARWYAHWEEAGLFRPDRPDAEPWTIVMPPPNVTGSLHIGHALDVTLQDILTRHARMQGKDALWVVGTDHAGIATQMVVERQMAEKQDKRTNYSRDEFIAKVWEWKGESGGQITRQLRRLGASCDWANERFTMDPGFSAAVTKVFVDLYNKGLLYRDKRLVNWDPGLRTAISDLEVETREVQGKFWHLRYPLADGSGAISVATTRPETMLADMAVAVNPGDERYTALIGKEIKLPITGRIIKIVPDEHADPELGSGAVKVTPGHDFNDFEVGRRAGIVAADMLNMFDAEAKVVQTSDGLIPDALHGLTVKDARAAVVALLEAESALERVEDRTIATPYGDRSGVVIEPWLTDQWYVDAATLVKPVLEATRSGAIKIVPESWSKTWFNWLENIQPWCVSRQLWWGHQIPAWFDEDGNIFVAETEKQARALAPNKTLRRDEDVLDTWFSSALWPFATLGWPEKTSDLARHYPNDVLISGFDILFFWDARMAMQGIEFMGRSGELSLKQSVPWKTLYLHGLVRDAAGQKMSKSKGNTVDPLGLIDQYGADALRFFMAAMESQGRDIKMDEARLAGYRNFATKLWNAARFLQGNGVGASASIAAPDAALPVNRWIIGEVVGTLATLDKAFADLRFDEAASAIYHFTWATFCDWYVELVKGEFTPPAGAGGEEACNAEGEGRYSSADTIPPPVASGDSTPPAPAGGETRQVAAWAFDQILVMLHPFMPFITEELWHSMGERPYELIVAKWPEPRFDPHPDQAEFNAAVNDILPDNPFGERHLDVGMKWFVETTIEIIKGVRALRTDLGIPWSMKLTPVIVGEWRPDLQELMENGAAFERMAKLNPPESAETVPPNSAQMVVAGTIIAFPLEGAIDLDAERSRLSKAIAAATKDRDSLAARLNNPAFAERAKPEAVDKARADHDSRAAEAERLAAALARLG